MGGGRVGMPGSKESDITVPDESRAVQSVRTHVLSFTAMCFQLVVIVMIMNQFDIESSAFRNVMEVALVGFVIHHFLPMRFRLAFYSLLSLASIPVALGLTRTHMAGPLLSAASLVGIGALLVGLCHLPIRFPYRVIALMVMTAVLVALRAHWLPMEWAGASWFTVIWPVIGSMFMFRLIIYMYDLKHRAVPFSPTRAMAYFFMLPNACFPLYPVIDYKTFCQTYYNDNPYRMYQRGLDWMLRGVVHLLLYRVVTHYLQLTPDEVVDIGTLGQFMATTFLLYLHVSGQFHIIIGLLQLFGFNLPETHHLYVLSSSFTDFWRRINIYWKEFMQKIFFFPIFFRLKHLGQKRALIVATVLVFIITWLMHSYQWFWIRGGFPIIWQEGIFWSLLCLLVIINSLQELKQQSRRQSGPQQRAAVRNVILAAKTIGTFLAIISIWTIWTSHSPDEVAYLFSRVTVITMPGLIGVVVGLAVIGVAAILFAGSKREWMQGKRQVIGPLDAKFARSVLVGILFCVGLHQVGRTGMWRGVAPAGAAFVASLQDPLSQRARELEERGYYEDLTDVSRYSRDLYAAYSTSTKPVDWPHIHNTPVGEKTDDLCFVRLIPLTHTVFNQKPVTINRWGMRDRDYPEHPQSGTFRMVILGASYTLGWGVGDDETFENIAEDRLNREAPIDGVERYELLNLAVNGYGPVQKLHTFETRVFAFKPDVVAYTAHSGELLWMVQRMQRLIEEDRPIVFEPLRQMVDEGGLTRESPEFVVSARLRQLAPTMLEWTYAHIVEACRRHGITPMWVQVPDVGVRHAVDKSDIELARRLAIDAGFRIIDVSNAFEGVRRDSLRVAEWDLHPNTEGHRLIADRFCDRLVQWLGERPVSPYNTDATGDPWRN